MERTFFVRGRKMGGNLRDAAMDPRPKFAADFPRDPALDALVDAFARGDYRRVRDEAPALAEKAEDEAVRRAAKELRARIEPDRAILWLIGLTAVLLAFLTGYWIVHGKAPDAPPPAPRGTAAP